MRCIAIDDEPLALDLLEDNIRQTSFLTLVGRCRNAMEALELLQREPVDLVFTDIQMPGLSGLQLIQALPAKPLFILITAHEGFALESYNLDVVDYLLKPVPYERFVKACTRALERHNLRRTGTGVAPPPAKDFIFLPLDYKMQKVSLPAVAFMEGVKDYVRIHFADATRPLLVRMSLKSMEEQVAKSGFLRIHKSYIVSIAHLSSIRKTSVFVGDAELPVGESYREALQKFIEGKSL